ncbi:MAG: class I SAM-dependent methyltransferase [Acidimicrobiales bacterium]
MTSAADRWRESLAAWALPDAIVASAEESPWIHPPELFGVPDEIVDTPSHARARESVPPGGTVLDVGCGGGIAAFAVVPPAGHVIGVDQQAEMLAMFRRNAEQRGVAVDTIEGSWPSVAPATPNADVVTAHHVLYNVGEVVPFLRALSDHARSRVVVELPDHHPLTAMAPAWRHFWQLERPDKPTPQDLLDVVAEMGLAAHREQWCGPPRTVPDPELAARFLRIRLCLPATREPDVLEFLRSRPPVSERELSTIWWDA